CTAEPAARASDSTKDIAPEKSNAAEDGFAAAAAFRDMRHVPRGKFLMGTNAGDGFPEDGEAPIHNVYVDAFEMAACTVTNAQFATFIQETGYVTDAEKYGWSFVFY